MRIAHSKEGIWEMSEIVSLDLWLTFTPILNTIFVVAFYPFISPKEKTNRTKNFNNFFKVKK